MIVIMERYVNRNISLTIVFRGRLPSKCSLTSYRQCFGVNGVVFSFWKKETDFSFPLYL